MFGAALSANAALYNYNNTMGDTFADAYKGYTGDDFSGFYLGTIGGNTGDMDSYINQYLFDIGFSDFNAFNTFKVEDGAGANPEGILTVGMYEKGDDGHASGWNSGEWWLAESYELGFYGVKGGPEFALYFVYEPINSGTWTTRHLLNPGGRIPEISHFTAKTSSSKPKQVPEPAVMMLMGAGLIGFAMFRRKQLGSDKERRSFDFNRFF